MLKQFFVNKFEKKNKKTYLKKHTLFSTFRIEHSYGENIYVKIHNILYQFL